ncbi:MAG: response regulator [Bdellovibrionaceae bacterium]|nr:response regulator [Pseudobdellovibrionaceae bacterium]
MIRIIMVDDNQLSLKRGEALLAPLGYEVLSFTGAEEALQTMVNHPVTLALIDLAMPIHSGFDLMKAMRDRNINTRIIVVSGKNRDEDVKKALSLGAQDYIMKPFDDDFFVAKVNLALELEKAERGGAAFAEAVTDQPSQLSFGVPQLAVSEVGFSFETPFPLPRGMKLDFKSAALNEMKLSDRPFRVAASQKVERGGETHFRNFVSFVGLTPHQLTEVRLWVRAQQIKMKKA